MQRAFFYPRTSLHILCQILLLLPGRQAQKRPCPCANAAHGRRLAESAEVFSHQLNRAGHIPLPAVIRGQSDDLLQNALMTARKIRAHLFHNPHAHFRNLSRKIRDIGLRRLHSPQAQQRLIFQLIRLLLGEQEAAEKLLCLLIFKLADDLEHCFVDGIVAHAEPPDEQRGEIIVLPPQLL